MRRKKHSAEDRKKTSSLATAGSLANVSVIAAYQGGLFNAEEIDILECRHEVVKRVKQAHDGNTVHVVGLLMAQALALNSVFTKLALQSAQADAGQSPRQMETYMRLALKAQSQCRATLEALVAVGNPPVMFAHQANVAFGPQQVNNFSGPNAGGLRPSDTVFEPNKLLEASNGDRMDGGAQGAAVNSDPAMAALGGIYRPA